MLIGSLERSSMLPSRDHPATANTTNRRSAHHDNPFRKTKYIVLGKRNATGWLDGMLRQDGGVQGSVGSERWA
ncbi:hypothetical protein [Planctopirus limnophila]|uniref:hypothetical protein n=1 Tax=Planctopirus limnophila TaxID=120 RepID=UPI0001A2FE20|nr:hypothetical protein [Planctopirus limnophila]